VNIITLDFESAYGGDLGFAKQTTEEYVRDPRFEVIGVAVQVNDGEPEWFSGDAIEVCQFLKGFDWEHSLALAHNAVFDGFILSERFGITPKGWLDTLSMGRALHGTEVGGSLKVLAQYYGLGEKGTEVHNFINYFRKDFSDEELTAYGNYCKNDVALTWALFQAMSADFPPTELRLIDLTIRMFTEPVLQLDRNVLSHHALWIKAKKEQVLGSFDKDVLMSNDKFAALLRVLKVEPPKKISPVTGKEAYAFSKTDEAFKALLDHEDPNVQAVVAARLGTKSTIEESRTERFIGIANRGALPVPLRYYAAHTGRWGGDDKVNLQNLPRTSALKKAIIAPDGYMMIDSDSSQIEARTLAWLAGQDDLVEAFERGEDVYCIMASAIYGRTITKADKEERFVGKTTILGCISEGTLVLSDSGWKPIEQVSLDDKLWDGEEWVYHQGLQNSGIKETLNLCGMWLTPDHKVWSGTQWLEAQSLVQDANTRSQALGTAVENLPLQATFADKGEALLRLSSNVTADPTSTAWTGLMSTETTSPTTSDSYPEATTLETNDESQILRRKLQTYDLAYAGPRNRYMVLTAQGPMIVHNCGYGMGAAKFQAALKNAGVEVPLEEAKRIIDTYRKTYPKITKLWKDAGLILDAIIRNQTTTLGRDGLLKVEGRNGIRLPNGLYLKYPNLRGITNDEGKSEYVYDTKRGKATVPNRIYGGKTIENVCQALARIVIGDQMLLVAKKYRVVMTVHDAIACIVPEDEVERAQEYVELCMKIRPQWGPDLPLNCEAGHGRSYGDC